jgi:hypothetical protein
MKLACLTNSLADLNALAAEELSVQNFNLTIR